MKYLSQYQARPPRGPAPGADDRLLVPGHLDLLHRFHQLSLGDKHRQAMAASGLGVRQCRVLVWSRVANNHDRGHIF